MAREPVKGSEPKLAQILNTFGRQADRMFKVMGSAVKVTERRS